MEELLSGLALPILLLHLEGCQDCRRAMLVVLLNIETDNL